MGCKHEGKDERKEGLKSGVGRGMEGLEVRGGIESWKEGLKHGGRDGRKED